MKLRYTLSALADLDAILDHIATSSPQGARSIHKRLLTAIELLTSYPRIGARTNDPAIRRIVVTPYPYLVFYEPTETVIIVHAIRHAARDPSGMPGVE